MTDPAGPPPARTVSRLARAVLALAVGGLGLATYLAVERATTDTPLSCPDTGIINCVKVTTSSYAVVAGVPVAVWGVAYFVAVVLLNLPVAWRHHGSWVRTLRMAVTASAVPAVLWLIYVELFRLDAICLWCTGVHVIAIAGVVLTVFATALTPPSHDHRAHGDATR